MSDNYNSGGSFIVNNNKHHQKIYGQRSRAEKSQNKQRQLFTRNKNKPIFKAKVVFKYK